MQTLFTKHQQVHFVGIGGIGMSGLAEILLNLGYQVSGSDARLSSTTERLQKLGAKIYEGHRAEQVHGAKVVVITSAVDGRNAEVAEARREGIPVIPRGELLAEMMRLQYGIAIAGSHGKTTTTSMVATMLESAGFDPTVVVGGKVGTMGGTNARLGNTSFLVVESDESDGSFLKLAPILCVVTNIDREHLDHYSDLDSIRDAFQQFVNKVPFYGAAVLCLDDENVQGILPNINRRVVTYGLSSQADLVIYDVQAGDLGSTFHLRYRGRELGEYRLNVLGQHNVLNATAAVAIGLELGIDPRKIASALELFRGVDRRFQIRGREHGVTVVDDYGHHPTEIRATLAAAKQARFSRVHVLFQPHRYTRTQALLDDFARAFHQADQVYVMDIYAASEQPIPGVTAEGLVERMRSFGQRSVQYVGTAPAGVEAILSQVRDGDAIITLGAGSVSQAGDAILAGLREIQ